MLGVSCFYLGPLEAYGTCTNGACDVHTCRCPSVSTPYGIAGPIQILAGSCGEYRCQYYLQDANWRLDTRRVVQYDKQRLAESPAIKGGTL